MPKPPDGNRTVLQGLITQSGLPLHAFARVMGIPCSTLQSKLRDSPVHDYVLHAARFTLMRLGISVKAPPIDWSAVQGHFKKQGVKRGSHRR